MLGTGDNGSLMSHCTRKQQPAHHVRIQAIFGHGTQMISVLNKTFISVPFGDIMESVFGEKNTSHAI